MKNPKTLASFAIVILLASCVGTSTPTLESPLFTDTPTIAVMTKAPSITATPTRAATATSQPASPTPAPTSTRTIPPEARLKIQCLEVAPHLSPSMASEGVIILDSRDGLDSLAINMATGVETHLTTNPNENLLYFVVSPDRKQIAYRRIHLDKPGGHTIKDELVIATADGKQQKIIPYERGWGSIIDWLDNERLVLLLPEPITPGTSGTSKAPTLTVVNPFTGQRQTLPPDFPNIYDWHPLPHWEGWNETVYDPTLTRVVYLRWVEPGGKYVYALWDLQNRKELATFFTILFPIPRWAPDGSQFVVAGIREIEKPGFELYSISRDGQQTSQLTSLTSYYPELYIQNYSWSPDGHYIALWLNEKPDSNEIPDGQHLAVLDMVTHEVTNYCVPGDFSTGIFDWVPPPIWSPNSKQLIVEYRYGYKASHVILVDIAQGFAAQITKNMKPIGWMASVP